ncbi:GerAB/ArcD/ProY family transporter [Metabacillus niabensis]|uniref:GerAB/ArcD/ProY family transporter n=1 Tax=Metabacillus niabensis TaxID=324854 RepID=UPI001CFAF4AF|nr:GerAB/ArcD/ProY family transporter [Metabacillus niabensis]
MEKAKVNGIQLFAMMFMFNLGTSVVVNYAVGAKKDAWLAILIGMSAGFVAFFIYYRLFCHYPNLPITGYAREILGKYVGWIIGLLYVLYFIHITTRQVRDFSELLVASTMTETPLLAIQLSFVLVICYVLYQGVEVLARTAEVFFVILIFLGAAGNFFVLVSGNFEFHNLRPFLENGWKPILSTAFREVTHWPFGEMVVFTMLLPYLNKSGTVKKVWVSALLLSGLALSWTASLNIAILGVDVMERTTFPTLATIGKVNLLEFIQRLDVIVVFTMLITVFFKASIFMYGAVIGIVDLFKLKNHQQILFPFGGIMIFSAMTIATNFSSYLNEGFRGLNRVVYPMFLYLPILMLIVSMIRKRMKKTN